MSPLVMGGSSAPSGGYRGEVFTSLKMGDPWEQDFSYRGELGPGKGGQK